MQLGQLLNELNIEMVKLKALFERPLKAGIRTNLSKWSFINAKELVAQYASVTTKLQQLTCFLDEKKSNYDKLKKGKGLAQSFLSVEEQKLERLFDDIRSNYLSKKLAFLDMSVGEFNSLNLWCDCIRELPDFLHQYVEHHKPFSQSNKRSIASINDIPLDVVDLSDMLCFAAGESIERDFVNYVDELRAGRLPRIRGIKMRIFLQERLKETNKPSINKALHLVNQYNYLPGLYLKIYNWIKFDHLLYATNDSLKEVIDECFSVLWLDDLENLNKSKLLEFIDLQMRSDLVVVNIEIESLYLEHNARKIESGYAKLSSELAAVNVKRKRLDASHPVRFFDAIGAATVSQCSKRIKLSSAERGADDSGSVNKDLEQLRSIHSKACVLRKFYF